VLEGRRHGGYEDRALVVAHFNQLAHGLGRQGTQPSQQSLVFRRTPADQKVDGNLAAGRDLTGTKAAGAGPGQRLNQTVFLIEVHK
jgi:hypothetical protein